MVQTRAVPGWPRFVGHAVRELCNRLPDEIVGEEAERLEYRNVVESIAARWQVEVGTVSRVEDGATPATESRVTISADLARRIDELVVSHNDVGRRQKDRFRRTMSDLLGKRAEQAAVENAVRSWREACDRAVPMCHDQTRLDSEVRTEDVEKILVQFEEPLSACIRSFSDTKRELDAILDKTNTR